MIREYTNHAANERTFLAWVRTGLAVVGFGFVIERFNSLALTIAFVAATDAGSLNHARTLQVVGHYDGLAVVAAGLLLIAVAAVRFVRVGRLLDDGQEHRSTAARLELLLSLALALIVASFTTFRSLV
jgi:putative membrane protein